MTAVRAGGLHEAIARLVDAYRRGMRLALLFDYDGTLYRWRRILRMAVFDRRARQRLEDLARLPFVYPGVLSGRSIDDLKHAVGIRGYTTRHERPRTGLDGADSTSGRRGRRVSGRHRGRARYGMRWRAFPSVGRAEAARTHGALSRRHTRSPRTCCAGARDRGVEPFEELCWLMDRWPLRSRPTMAGTSAGTALRAIVEHLGGDGVVPRTLAIAERCRCAERGRGPRRRGHRPPGSRRAAPAAGSGAAGPFSEALTKILACANARRSCPEAVSAID